MATVSEECFEINRLSHRLGGLVHVKRDQEKNCKDILAPSALNWVWNSLIKQSFILAKQTECERRAASSSE